MKQTSQTCMKFMQRELIRHLWSVFDEFGGTDCVFILSSRRLGDGMVQDITVFNENTSSHQTVFGYKPVDLTIQICGNGVDITMSLIPSIKTSYEIGKLKSIRSTLSFQKKITPTHLTQKLYLS